MFNLRLAGFHSPPFTILSEGKDGKLQDKGLLKDFIKTVTKQLNISDEIFESKEGYGNQNKNNNWNGIIGMLMRNECDMSVSMLSLSEERSAVISFSDSLIVTPHIIISSSGVTLDRKITDYLFTINYAVWLLLLGTIFALNAFYFFHQKLNDKSFTLQILSYIKILLSQSSNSRQRLSAYTFVVSLFILNYALFRIYLNSLIGVEIIINSDKHAIDSLEDLAETKNVIPSFDSGSGIKTFFQKSNLSSNKQIWRRIKEYEKLSIVPYNSQFKDPLRSLIVNGRLAVIKLLIDGWLLKIGFCKMNPEWKLHFSSETVMTTSMSLGFRKDLDKKITLKINQIINLMVSNGLMNKWIADMYWTQLIDSDIRSCVFDTHNNVYNLITLRNTETLIYWSLTAISIALLVLLSEICANNFHILS